MCFRSINHVQLGFAAGQQAEIRRFYGELIGLREIEDASEPGTLRFHAGSLHLELVPSDAGDDESLSPGHLAFSGRNLPGLRARLAAGGVAVDEGHPLPGHLHFHVNDPAGNALEFLEPAQGVPA